MSAGTGIGLVCGFVDGPPPGGSPPRRRALLVNSVSGPGWRPRHSAARALGHLLLPLSPAALASE